MEWLLEAYKWVAAHWLEIAGAMVYVVGAARIIVKLTPTPKDDTVLAKIIGLLKAIGLHVE